MGVVGGGGVGGEESGGVGALVCMYIWWLMVWMYACVYVGVKHMYVCVSNVRKATLSRAS